MLEGHNCTLDSLYNTIVEKEPKAVDPALARKIQEKAAELEGVTSENEHVVKAAELTALIGQAAPAGFWKKVSTLQTMGQLLNPKTAIRNIVGNAGFLAAETASDVLAASIDNALSLFTGKRTKVLPQLQAGGFLQGLKEGVRDAVKGIDTSASATKFDLPKGQVFKNPVLKGMETALNIELRATDRAFYTLAYRESLANQLKASGVEQVTDSMIARAHADALYKTFQDDTVAATLFSGVKRVLNVVSPESAEKIRSGRPKEILNNDFGLGELVLKYPRTPANILMRGLDYSPAGFVKAFYEAVRPMIGQEFNQRQFVEAMSRATVGSGSAVGLGYYLHKLGLITGERDEDRDLAGTLSAQGVGPYQMNASGMMRFVLGGFNPEEAKPQPDDILVSYDWALPMAIPVTMGANIAKSEFSPDEARVMSAVGQVLDAATQGANTLAEQPMLQGLQTLFGSRYGESKGIAGGFQETIAGLPASFVPTAVSQINQLIDNVSRETRGNSVYETGWNRAKAKIPGAAQTLEPRRDVLGNEKERYRNATNTVANVLFNPAFVSQLGRDPLLDEIVRIYGTTGETRQALREAPWSVVISGGGATYSKKLTPKEHGQYQQYIGKVSAEIIQPLIGTAEFQQLNDVSKADLMADILRDVNAAAKITLFEHNPGRRASLLTRSIVMENPDYAHNLIMQRIYKEIDGYAANY